MSERRAPNLAFRLAMGDRELRAIGHVAAQWAVLETLIDQCIGLLLAQPQAAHLTLKVPLSFKRRTRLWRECADAIFHNHSAQLKEMQEIIDAAASLRGKRDEVIHGQWHVRQTKGGRKTTGISVLSQLPNWQLRGAQITAEQTEDIAGRISEVTARLYRFLEASTRNPAG